MFAAGYLSDHFKMRGPTLITQSLIIITGATVMAFAGNPGVRYFGVFLAVGGTNSNIPTIYGYQHNNISKSPDLNVNKGIDSRSAGQTKRALATAMLLMGGGCGGIVASFVFRQKDAPDYLPGMIAVIVSQVITVLLVSMNTVYFWHRNRKADRGEAVLENTPGFRYTY
jgi:MFS family permease